jgi:hypothetical protein
LLLFCFFDFVFLAKKDDVVAALDDADDDDDDGDGALRLRRFELGEDVAAVAVAA